MKGRIDKGIKQFTLSTGIRWFGWGFGDPFLPILFLMMSDSFLGTGFLTSLYHVIFFLFIPFAGVLADKIKSKKMIAISMLIYVFIGLGYFLAGFTGMIIFLIIGRALNGISYPLDQIGRESYFIRHSNKKHESEVFGRFDRITGTWQIIAIILGMFLVKYVGIHWLLLMVVPTSIISLFIVLRVKEKKLSKKKKGFSNPYLKLFKEIKGFNKNLKTLAVLTFFFGMMRTIVYFFAPSVTYARGESLTSSALLILAFSVPWIFGERLGKLADKLRDKSYYLALSSLILVLITLAFSPNYYLLLGFMFLAGLAFELIGLTDRAFMARNSDYERIGEIDGAINAIRSIGSIIGPIIFGFILDFTNPMVSYFSIAVIVFLMIFFVNKRT